MRRLALTGVVVLLAGLDFLAWLVVREVGFDMNDLSPEDQELHQMHLEYNRQGDEIRRRWRDNPAERRRELERCTRGGWRRARLSGRSMGSERLAGPRCRVRTPRTTPGPSGLPIVRQRRACAADWVKRRRWQCR